MASENGLWKTIDRKQKLIPAVEFQRHEDKFSTGIPDTSYSCLKVNGWIELKQKHKWPARPETPLKIDHYTPDQKNWLWRHGEAGGHCWLLLQVSNEYLLFNHKQAQNLGMMTESECFKTATAYWAKELPLLKLLEILTRSYHA